MSGKRKMQTETDRKKKIATHSNIFRDHNPEERPSFDEILDILWHMKDDKGDFFCQKYKKVKKSAYKALIGALASPDDILSLGLTCKHFLKYHKSKLFYFKI